MFMIFDIKENELILFSLKVLSKELIKNIEDLSHLLQLATGDSFLHCPLPCQTKTLTAYGVIVVWSLFQLKIKPVSVQLDISSTNLQVG